MIKSTEFKLKVFAVMHSKFLLFRIEKIRKEKF